MSTQANLNIRTDADVKVAAEQLFNALGLTMSAAVNIFLRQSLRQGGLPFEVKLDIPNETTAAAIEEGRALMHDKNAKGYRTIDELRAALEV